MGNPFFPTIFNPCSRVPRAARGLVSSCCQDYCIWEIRDPKSEIPADGKEQILDLYSCTELWPPSWHPTWKGNLRLRPTGDVLCLFMLQVKTHFFVI